jgi:hypothetical protein
VFYVREADAHDEALERDLNSLKSPHEREIEALLQRHSNATANPSELAHIDEIQACFEPTSVDDIARRLQKHETEWARQQFATINRVSPLSVKIAFEQLKRGSHLSLAQCLVMEYRVSQHMMVKLKPWMRFADFRADRKGFLRGRSRVAHRKG